MEKLASDGRYLTTSTAQLIHSDDSSDVQQYTFTGSDFGIFAISFVDYDGDNFVADVGDRVEAEVRGPLGERLGETTRDVLPLVAIDTHLVRLDVNASSSPVDATTWGRIKALYRSAR